MPGWRFALGYGEAAIPGYVIDPFELPRFSHNSLLTWAMVSTSALTLLPASKKIRHLRWQPPDRMGKSYWNQPFCLVVMQPHQRYHRGKSAVYSPAVFPTSHVLSLASLQPSYASDSHRRNTFAFNPTITNTRPFPLASYILRSASCRIS